MAEPPTIITGASPILKYPNAGAAMQMEIAASMLNFWLIVKFCIDIIIYGIKTMPGKQVVFLQMIKNGFNRYGNN